MSIFEHACESAEFVQSVKRGARRVVVRDCFSESQCLFKVAGDPCIFLWTQKLVHETVLLFWKESGLVEGGGKDRLLFSSIIVLHLFQGAWLFFKLDLCLLSGTKFGLFFNYAKKIIICLACLLVNHSKTQLLIKQCFGNP